MRDGDFGDDSGFTDVQMLMEFRCADHEANSYLLVLCNWSPMLIKQNTECPCN